MTDYIKTVKAYEGTEPYIFISYAHKDSDKVLPLIAALQSNGYNVWFDNGIQAGSEWPIYIEERLTDCTTMLVFMSEAAVASRNCRNEINLALKLNKEILVVHLEETVLRYGMELQLGSVQALFKYRQPDESQFINNLVTAEALRSVHPDFIAKNASKTVGSESNSNEPVFAHAASSAKQKNSKSNAPLPADGSDDTAEENIAGKTKRTQLAKYVILVFSALAFALGSISMYFISPMYINAATVGGLLITLALILPVVLLISIPVAIIKKKSLKYTKPEKQKIYDDTCTIIVSFGFLAIFIDCFLVGSTENVFFKILISIGINIARYFISMMFTPDEPK